jgi:putative endonuclease
MASHNELGQKGEDKAALYLAGQGYKIIARNYRFGKKEIDIIAWDGPCLVIVEVRTRTTEFWEHPRDTISAGKIRMLVEAAEAFILNHELDCETRFDLVCWVPHPDDDKWELEHVEEAFHPTL